MDIYISLYIYILYRDISKLKGTLVCVFMFLNQFQSFCKDIHNFWIFEVGYNKLVNSTSMYG